MKSRLASARAAGGLDRVDRAVHLLEDEWQRHGEVQLERIWAQEQRPGAVDSVEALGLLGELVKADLRCRFEKGQTPTAAGYIERFPELRATHSRVLSLVYEEYCLNEERGTAPDVESFCNRYPDWKSSLASQLEYHRLFSQVAGRRPSLPCFPEAGQEFEGFRLEALLGKGGMSRVFLARDVSLGGKQVVLKVTLDRGQEPQVQGPLDHPHIVPVNSVVYQTGGQLCGLSMPYQPGLPLDEVITLVDPAARPRKAIALWRALVSGTADPTNTLALDGAVTAHRNALAAGPRGDGWEGFPLRGSYAEGVAWIAMILARALHYAHGKQTFHRDVKPGNVLLTRQHGPQLLDFNLAESPHSADHAQAAVHGGTLPYMAPEQIEAFINPDLWGKVGAGADVYSLGLVLRELLTGQKPELPDPALTPARSLHAVLDRRPFLDVAVRRFNPAIPHALEAIVAKCLTLAPADRYTDAEELEQDLDRFLKHKPLTLVVNPSRRERLGNWVTRHRRVLARVAIIPVLEAFLFVLAVYSPFLEKVKPRIETNPSFVSAVGLLEQGQPDRAADLLASLQKANPHSCGVELYLSFALKSAKNDDHQKQYEADEHLRQALATQDAESTLAALAKQHPQVSHYLVDFAESRIQRADLLAERFDNGNPVEDDERDNAIRKPFYRLAYDALRRAVKLGPSDCKTKRLLARTEQLFGLYAPAYKRLSSLIGSFDPGQQTDMLFFSHELRGWIARAWAEQDLESNSVALETRKRLQVAANDFDYCAQFLEERDFGESQARKEFYVMQHSLRAMVTLAEVELELSLPLEAKKHLDECLILRDSLISHIKSNKLNRIPPTTRLKRRIDVALSRLKQSQNVASGRSPTRAEDQPTVARSQ